MYTDKKWYRIRVGYGGVEDFYPMEHVSHSEWGRVFALPDSSLLDIKVDDFQQSERSPFSITNVSHTTDSAGVEGILADQCMKCAKGKKIGENLSVRFSWWHVEVNQLEKEEKKKKLRDRTEKWVRENTGELLQDVGSLRDSLLEQFISSPAFLEVSNYGNFKFTYNINDLIGEYKKSVCKGEDPELRVLGTFRYDREVMHTVVVHPPGEPIFQSCPSLPSEVISQEGPEWEWRPESTGSEMRGLTQDGDGSWKVINYSPHSRSWEYPSFAFYLPEEKPEFPVPLEYRHLTVCEMEPSQRFRKGYLSVERTNEKYRSLKPTENVMGEELGIYP